MEDVLVGIVIIMLVTNMVLAGAVVYLGTHRHPRHKKNDDIPDDHVFLPPHSSGHPSDAEASCFVF